MKENREDKAEPRLKKRGLLFFYGMAQEKMLGQTGTHSNYMFLKAHKRHACQHLLRDADLRFILFFYSCI